MIRNLAFAVICGLLCSRSVSSQQSGAINELPKQVGFCPCVFSIRTLLLNRGQHSILGTCRHYFWNEVTGDTQLEDPGDVPLHDEEGNCFWLDEAGQRLDQDPKAGSYAWIEMYSEEHKRPFYYDQQNLISTWDKPADLAWRRVYIPDGPVTNDGGATVAGDQQAYITDPTGNPNVHT